MSVRFIRAFYMNRQKILIIEDEQECLVLLELFLKDFYDVETAEDAIDGFEKFVEFKPDLVITDIVLPRMVSGFDLIVKIRQVSAVPVIGITGKGQHVVRSAIKSGAFVVLQKPFEKDELMDSVSQALAAGQIAIPYQPQHVILLLKDSGLEQELRNFFEEWGERPLLSSEQDVDKVSQNILAPSMLITDLKFQGDEGVQQLVSLKSRSGGAAVICFFSDMKALYQAKKCGPDEAILEPFNPVTFRLVAKKYMRVS